MKFICILCPMVQNRTFCDQIRINIVLSLTKNSFPTSLTINFATISCQDFVFVIFRCENYCYKKTVFQSNRGRIWSFLSGSGLCCLRIRPLLSSDPAIREPEAQHRIHLHQLRFLTYFVCRGLAAESYFNTCSRLLNLYRFKYIMKSTLHKENWATLRRSKTIQHF